MTRYDPLTPAEMFAKYDMSRGMLRPDYAKLDDAQHIRRDPDSFEISWPPSKIEDELRRLGLL